jgi:hypothetical protein
VAKNNKRKKQAGNKENAKKIRTEKWEGNTYESGKESEGERRIRMRRKDSVE